MQKMTSFESVSSDGDLCQSMCDNESDSYYEPNGQNYYTQLYPADAPQSGNRLLTEDSYWEDGSPCSSSPSMEQIECSPNNYINNVENNSHNQSPYHHHYTTQVYCTSHQQYDKNGFFCDESYYGATTTTTNINGNQVVRVIKRRTTANKKERRRTQSINSAYSCLRDRIPNVPSDTKLSKIKTLRLATSYISYLINVLDGEQEPSGFRAELVPSSRKINAERRAIIKNELQNSALLDSTSVPSSRKKGRTGWPQAVWANMVK